MQKLSEFIANYLAEKGLTQVFMMTGGGAMHLNDALGKCPKLNVVFQHHEQACAIAAEAYARLCGKPAILNVTTGPGGLNALTGVFGAYTDSIPMIVISGQVRYDTTVESTGLPLRQFGDQECNIVDTVKSMTKMAVMLKEPLSIKAVLDEAIETAISGRPGPVWIDVPLNLQAAMIDPSQLTSEVHSAATLSAKPDDIVQLISKLKKAERPVVMLGTGVRIAGMTEPLLQLLETLQIPVVTAFNAHDLVPDSHPLYVGRPGTVGDRAGNFAVQNSDFLLILGCRMNIRQVGFNFKSFARAAYQVMVDADPLEMQKPNLAIDLAITADLSTFIPALTQALSQPVQRPEWLAWCQTRREKYPVVLPQYFDTKSALNPYVFMQALSQQLPEGQITVTGDGTACVVAFQSFIIKARQRLFSNSGCAPMGYGLPAAIGAAVASGESVVCLDGDGSVQLNIQELAQVAYHQYPIKLFVINNGGYVSIRQTQKNYFGMPYVGCGEDSGLGFPDLEQLAKAYGLPYVKISEQAQLNAQIDSVLRQVGPVLCEVIVEAMVFAPKLSSRKLPDGRMVSKPLEDLAPFLSEEELKENMLIDLMDEDAS